jgi:hypothetical protein
VTLLSQMINIYIYIYIYQIPRQLHQLNAHSYVMHGRRERMTDIWFVFGILKCVVIFGGIMGVTWIL